MTVQIEWKKDKDPITGYEVWQMTSYPSNNCPPYFESQGFTADDKYILFATDKHGEWCMCRADIETGEIEELVQVKHQCAYSIHPDGIHAYYMWEWQLRRVHVASKKVETVIDFEGSMSTPPGNNYTNSFTADGKWMLLPRNNEIYIADLETGKFEKVYTIDGHYSHPMICPDDPNLIVYCPLPDTQNDMSLPIQKRAHTLQVDIREGIPRPHLMVPKGFRATHATFSHDGKRFFYFKKKHPEWTPVSICSMNKEGKDIQEHYTSQNLKLGHGISSNDGDWYIADTQDPDHNYVILLNLETGKATTLCEAGASIHGGHSKMAHIHPFLSQSGRYVGFMSNRTGYPQTYVVPIGHIVDSA